MIYQVGDIVDVWTGVILSRKGKWWSAIVIKTSNGRPYVRFISPPTKLKKYVDQALGHQSGLWSAGTDAHNIRPAKRVTDKKIAVQTAFLLTGEFVSFT